MNNLINGDCFDIMSGLSPNSIDAIISDIPYGIGFHGEKDPDTGWDNFEDQEYIEFLDRLFSETYRITKEDSIMFLFIAPTKMFDVIKTCEQSKWKFLPQYTYYYCRAKGRQAKNKLKSLREDILCFAKSDDIKLNWDQIRKMSDHKKKTDSPIGYSLDICTGNRIPQFELVDHSFFITAPSYNNIGDKQIHSCQKPTMLISNLIQLCTKEGDTVLDPFMGSGSTAIAAHFCKRNFIGIELDKKMFDKANEWLNSAKDVNSRIFEYLNKNLTIPNDKFVFGIK